MKIGRGARLKVATVMWIGVAVFLAWRGTIRHDPDHGAPEGFFKAIGSAKWQAIALLAAAVIGGLKGRFVLQKSAVRTARFIQRRPESDWFWMSVHPVIYVMIPLMMGMGIALRNTMGKDHPALIVGVYCGIACGLLVGARGFHLKDAQSG